MATLIIQLKPKEGREHGMAMCDVPLLQVGFVLQICTSGTSMPVSLLSELA